MVLLGYPEGVSPAAPVSPSPLRSERRDGQDVDSPPPLTQPINTRGEGAVRAVGGFLYMGSECEAQSLWPSSWRHIVKTFVKHSVAARF